jgi:hypothetical protein
MKLSVRLMTPSSMASVVNAFKRKRALPLDRQTNRHVLRV